MRFSWKKKKKKPVQAKQIKSSGYTYPESCQFATSEKRFSTWVTRTTVKWQEEPGLKKQRDRQMDRHRES